MNEIKPFKHDYFQPHFWLWQKYYKNRHVYCIYFVYAHVDKTIIIVFIHQTKFIHLGRWTKNFWFKCLNATNCTYLIPFDKLFAILKCFGDVDRPERNVRASRWHCARCIAWALLQIWRCGGRGWRWYFCWGLLLRWMLLRFCCKCWCCHFCAVFFLFIEYHESATLWFSSAVSLLFSEFKCSGVACLQILNYFHFDQSL